MALDPTLTAIITILAGAAAGGVVSHLNDRAQFKREKEWEHCNFVRGKLEELHDAIQNFDYEYKAGMSAYKNAVVPDKPSEAKAVEFGEFDIMGKFSKISLLINFYAPELKESSNTLHRTIAKFVEDMNSMQMKQPVVNFPVPNESALAMKAKVEESSFSISSQCEAMQSQLAKVAEQYAVRF